MATACLLAGVLGCAGTAPPGAAPGSVPGPAPVPSAVTLHEVGAGLPRSGQWRNGFALADLDGDGYLDLVHGPARKGARRPVVFLGDGGGGFRTWEEVRFPDLPYDYGDVVVADLDGDGRPDLALAMHLRGVVALRNAGGGVFEEHGAGLPLAARPGAGFSSRALAATDWDGDGSTDLVAFGEGPSRFGFGSGPQATGLWLFLNRGDGWTAVPPPAPDPAFGDSLAVADLDGDGRPDAVTSAGGADGRAILHLNSGGGYRQEEIATLRPGALVSAVVAARLDRDSRVDLGVSYLVPEDRGWHAGIDLLLAREDGYERRELVCEEGRNPFRALAAGDLDGDGAIDLVGVRGDGTLLVFPAARPELATTVPAPDWRQGCSGYGLGLGDLDGDGRAEIVASFAGEPGGLSLEPQCVRGGGIDAWSVGEGSR